jgi:predicted nucleic acid-binding protein
MAGYLLDTNHLGQAVTRTSPVRRHLEEVRKSGIRVGTCVPVLCEIEAGILQVKRPDEYRQNLRRLFRQVRIWPLDWQTAQHFGEIYHALRRQGRILSQVDIMAAALARQMGLTVLTTDRDFEALPEIRTENWVGP